jgi:hypothetical protein
MRRAEKFNQCLEDVKVIIRRLGATDQNSTRVYSEGDLRFERTNTGDTEVRLKGQLGLSVPLVNGSRQRPIWEPGDWVEITHEIRGRTDR